MKKIFLKKILKVHFRLSNDTVEHSNTQFTENKLSRILIIIIIYYAFKIRFFIGIK